MPRGSLHHLTSPHPEYTLPQPSWRSPYLPHPCRHLNCRHFTSPNYVPYPELRCRFRWKKERNFHEKKEHKCARECEICQRQRRRIAHRGTAASHQQQNTTTQRRSSQKSVHNMSSPTSSRQYSARARERTFQSSPQSATSPQSVRVAAANEEGSVIKCEYPLHQLRELLELKGDDDGAQEQQHGRDSDMTQQTPSQTMNQQQITASSSRVSQARPRSAISSRNRSHSVGGIITTGSGLRKSVDTPSTPISQRSVRSRKRPMSATLSNSSYYRRKSYQIDYTSVPVVSRSSSSTTREDGNKSHKRPQSAAAALRRHHTKTGSSASSTTHTSHHPSTTGSTSTSRKRPMSALGRYRMRQMQETGREIPTSPNFVSSYHAAVDPLLEDYQKRQKSINHLEETENEVPLKRRGSWVRDAAAAATLRGREDG